MKDKISVIAFDADDTLWSNEPFFRASEERFAEMFSDFMPPHDVIRALLKVEIANIPVLGYGVKSFVISMLETALEISDHQVSADALQKIVAIGKDQLQQPVEILENVEQVLSALQGRFKLVMATKGDLLEQETKLIKSGLEKYFHHIEILSEKKEPNYKKLINHLDIPANEFLMIGNSLKSDILPILNLGGYAAHIPFHTTWEYEKVSTTFTHDNFYPLSNISEVLELLK
ncbi:HAD family hydrolase [Portibacter lacus]|nr:HAD family hydrolase [Portibacter lacus]